MGNEATESLYDDEVVRNIMERHYSVMKEFRELEFLQKLRMANKTRMKGYEDLEVSEGDWIYYQHKDGKTSKWFLQEMGMMCLCLQMEM